MLHSSAFPCQLEVVAHCLQTLRCTFAVQTVQFAVRRGGRVPSPAQNGGKSERVYLHFYFRNRAKAANETPFRKFETAKEFRRTAFYFSETAFCLVPQVSDFFNLSTMNEKTEQ